MELSWRLVVAAAVVLSAAAMLLVPAAADGTRAEDFACPLCKAMVARAAPHLAASPSGAASVLQIAKATCAAEDSPYDGCGFLVPPFVEVFSQRASAWAGGGGALDPRGVCVAMGMCPASELWAKSVRSGAEGAANVDLRVALAHGARGYDAIRISVIDDGAAPLSPQFRSFFSYSAPFRYYWTNKTLSTVIKPMPSGGANASGDPITATFEIDQNLTIKVPLPQRGAGVRLLLVADPCFSSEFVTCEYGDAWRIFPRLVTMLNAALERDDVDGWVLIGDNFYDPHGFLGPAFFSQLSLRAKSKPIISVPGNHDFWQHGKPEAKGFDTFGNGYMQYYTMDTAASVANDRSGHHGVPFNFSVIPSDVTKVLPPFANFFYYSMMGNVAFIGYSSAHTRAEAEPYFVEACAWVKKVRPGIVLLTGHWSAENYGCQPHMDTRKVREHLITLDGCAQIHDRVKWLEGHSHCNLIVKKNDGFRVAGFGMSGCGNFGFPYVDTHNNEFKIGYFAIIGGNGTVPNDEEAAPAPVSVSFDTLAACIAARGIQGCTEYATLWHRKKI